MKYLFDEVSEGCSKAITEKYSTSFSLGIYFLKRKLRKHIYAIYGLVRAADEIVDSFEGYDKEMLLEKFIQETNEALKNRISLNPILNSFQHTVHKFHIGEELITQFFDSMRMDLGKIEYTDDKYENYIVGSAEVVGLMCLHIFTENDRNKYNELSVFARSLGAAFQKVNFLRDIHDDYHSLGRVYFPGVNISRLTNEEKKKIEMDIMDDFKSALTGIRKLPASSRGGVYLAYVYYMSLFKKIRRVPAERVMSERIRINNAHKFGLMINSLFLHKMNSL